MSYQSGQVVEAWKQAERIVEILERWIESHDEVRPHVKLSQNDKLRLLRLRTWELRHYLPVSEIINLTLPRLRDMVHRKHYKVKSGGIGVTVATLVGDKAELILIEAIEEKYPGAEHIAAWKEAERELQLELEQQIETEGLSVRTAAPLTILGCPSVQDFITRYKARIGKEREQLEEQTAAKWRKRRNYRGNPWR